MTRNEHNKRMCLSKLLVLLCGLFVLCGCRNTGRAEVDQSGIDTIELEQPLSDIVEEPDIEPPSPSYKFESEYRKLTDAEIAELAFDGYEWSKAVDAETFGRWKEFIGDYRPYYSKLTCPLCGQHLLVVYSENPQEYWDGLCGRGGYFFICTHCKRIRDFECVVMN